MDETYENWSNYATFAANHFLLNDFPAYQKARRWTTEDDVGQLATRMQKLVTESKFLKEWDEQPEFLNEVNWLEIAEDWHNSYLIGKAELERQATKLI